MNSFILREQCVYIDVDFLIQMYISEERISTKTCHEENEILVQTVEWKLKRIFERVIVGSEWFKNGNKELSYVISGCTYCWKYRPEWWTNVYEPFVDFSQTIQNTKVSGPNTAQRWQRLLLLGTKSLGPNSTFFSLSVLSKTVENKNCKWKCHVFYYKVRT